jgi:hypothetical protein
MSFTALSIIQPWPWLILRPDVADAAARAELRRARLLKDCENREWETPFRGWCLMHASSTRLAKWDYQAAVLFAAKRGVEIPLVDLPYGAVVGAMRIDACTWSHRSPWAVGPRMFVIGEAVPFAAAVPCKGAPRFFQVGADLDPEFARHLQTKLTAAIRAAGLAAAFKLEAVPGVLPQRAQSSDTESTEVLES